MFIYFSMAAGNSEPVFPKELMVLTTELRGFDVLLTVHLGTFILVINQFDAQILSSWFRAS